MTQTGNGTENRSESGEIIDAVGVLVFGSVGGRGDIIHAAGVCVAFIIRAEGGALSNVGGATAPVGCVRACAGDIGSSPG